MPTCAMHRFNETAWSERKGAACPCGLPLRRRRSGGTSAATPCGGEGHSSKLGRSAPAGARAPRGTRCFACPPVAGCLPPAMSAVGAEGCYKVKCLIDDAFSGIIAPAAASGRARTSARLACPGACRAPRPDRQKKGGNWHCRSRPRKHRRSLRFRGRQVCPAFPRLKSTARPRGRRPRCRQASGATAKWSGPPAGARPGACRDRR